ncbi:MAG TPA: pyridoxamine 5'-phosphate oxidase family protein [Acidimicrobiales bacterium]|nr:pyridoxamine 5'-phosphate oxidase family protein [Acidimicrobiales bacterium]
MVPATEAGSADINEANPGDNWDRVDSTRMAGPMNSYRANRHTIMESTNLADLYGLPPIDWTKIEGLLAEGVSQAPNSGGPDRHTCWLATINRDGSPHVTGIGALWFDGSFWFETGEQTLKGRNLARDPRCSLSLATRGFDLVIDGGAEKVTDPATVATMAERWHAAGWHARVDESGMALTADYSAPSAGPPPWTVYRIAPRQATALATDDPGGATRWRFAVN